MINQYSGRYDRAESDLLRALDIDPNSGDLLRRLGQVRKAARKFNEARMDFNRAAELQPGYFKNYQEICALEIEQANYDTALQQCGRMVAAARGNCSR